LQVQSNTEDKPVDAIMGFAGEPVGAGIDTTWILALRRTVRVSAIARRDRSLDWIVPNAKAATVLLSGNNGVGLRAPKTGVDLPGRVVFLSFPFDAVPLGSGIGNNRAGLLLNILHFLAPSTNTSTLTLDSDVYSLPGRAVIEVEDGDMQGQGQTTVTVHSPQHASSSPPRCSKRRDLDCSASGFFLHTNTDTPDTLIVNADDTVEFDYLDESASATVSATITIKTNAPTVTGGVFIEPATWRRS